jgi:hypothetical protein
VKKSVCTHFFSLFLTFYYLNSFDISSLASRAATSF